MRDIKAYFRAYYEANRERIKARAAEYRRNNQEKAREAVKRCNSAPDAVVRLKAYAKQYYQQNAETIKQRSRDQHERRRDDPAEIKRRREYGKQWRDEKRHMNRAKARAYYAARTKRCPQWVSTEQKWMMLEAYEIAVLRERATGIRWHVDHIVPLQGKIVSGLHVPWNLQVIPASENVRKSNRF
jgi:hypothetical protein